MRSKPIRYLTTRTTGADTLTLSDEPLPNTCAHLTRDGGTEVHSSLSPDWYLALQAFNTLRRIDLDLMEARAEFNDDWFRRTMRARRHAVRRLRRRWNRLKPRPAIPLGRLRRRFHANIAGYLY